MKRNTGQTKPAPKYQDAMSLARVRRQEAVIQKFYSNMDRIYVNRQMASQHSRAGAIRNAFRFYPNRYELCHRTVKAVRNFHIPSNRMPETITVSLEKLAASAQAGIKAPIVAVKAESRVAA